MNKLDLVRTCFEDPEIEDEVADMILWGCTGYPCFLSGRDKMKTLVKQLYHARRSLARGFSMDNIYFGEDTFKNV